MQTLVHHLLTHKAKHAGHTPALSHKKDTWSYQQIAEDTHQLSLSILQSGLAFQDRMAIYLPKQKETVLAMFAACQAGNVFVPVNPVLKAPQVVHILNDCNVKLLFTSAARLQAIIGELDNCPDLATIVLVDGKTEHFDSLSLNVIDWQAFLELANPAVTLPTIIDSHMAAILYTSGSTGKPKGVVLSHKNIVLGAASVAEYLHITPQDKILAVLPFSFDYGLNQLTTSFLQGAHCVLLDYLLPNDVVKALKTHHITGLAAVPPLWAQLAQLDWPAEINQHLRYMTNSGGKMPKVVLEKIRQNAPSSQFYLMYGLTEAFRSTFLPPEQIDTRPDSMGKAIPNAEILVVREDGSPCEPNEPGELVHMGSLVAMGYWNAPEKTAERFKPAPNQISELPLTQIAVWSGDQVQMDEEGYLYFVGRKDDMIKTSGYRVSPSEVEETIYSTGLVKEAAAIGVEHPSLGQAILVVVQPDSIDFDDQELLKACRASLPNFMIPSKIIYKDAIPKNPNGKIDRKQLSQQYADLFQ